jgi:hypothetical protein
MVGVTAFVNQDEKPVSVLEPLPPNAEIAHSRFISLKSCRVSEVFEHSQIQKGAVS